MRKVAPFRRNTEIMLHEKLCDISVQTAWKYLRKVLMHNMVSLLLIILKTTIFSFFLQV